MGRTRTTHGRGVDRADGKRPTTRRPDQMDPDQPGEYTVRTIPRLDRVVWRYRWQLAPIGAGLLAWCVVAGLDRGEFWTMLALVLGAGVVHHHARRLHRDEQAYAAAAYSAGVGWALVMHLAGVHRWGVLVWAALVVAGGVPWWRHRRVRARIHLDRTMRAWPATANRAGLDGVRAVSARMDGIAEVIRLETQRGRQRVADVAGRLEFIAQVLGLPVRSLRLVPDQQDPGMADLVVVRSDPWRSKTGQAVDQVHPAIGDPQAWAGRDRTIRRPVRYGSTQPGGPAELVLWTEQGGRILAVVGKKGAGKSVTVHSLLADLAPCRDVRLVGIDVPKRGHTLAAWARRLHCLATTPAEAVDALREVYEVIGQRGASLGSPVHQPTPAEPAYVVVVEELGATVEQHDEIGALLASIGRLVRSASVSLLLVDQRPDHTTWPGVLRSNVDDVLAGRMGRRGDGKLVLPGHSQVDLTAIPEDLPGWMVQQVGTGEVVPVRSWRLEEPDHIAGIVAACLAVVPAATVGGTPIASRSTRRPEAPMKQGRTTASDARARVEAALTAYEADTALPRTPARGSMDDLSEGHQYTEPDPHPGDDDLDRAIVAAVQAAQGDGIAIADLVGEVGAARATVQRRAGALRRGGHLELRPERGPAARWYTTQSDTAPVA